jgi:clan AA aspartic protease
MPEAMGLTYAEVTLIGPEGRRASVHLLVDSGATFSVIPREVAADLGVRPQGERRFELANGQVVTRPVGQLEVEFAGHRTWTKVVLGEPQDTKLLGAYTLEGLELQLDPVRRELRPVEAHSLMAQAEA